MPGIDRLVHEPARFELLAQLYVVKGADALFLRRQSGLSWGNLSSHLSKLEAAGYVKIVKEFVDRKPHTMLYITGVGREAFDGYRQQMAELLKKLPRGQ